LIEKPDSCVEEAGRLTGYTVYDEELGHMVSITIIGRSIAGLKSIR
jgi:hypothetical protein